MQRFIIHWDCGNCTDSAVVEVNTEVDAERLAKEEWESNNQMRDLYWAEPYSAERAEELGLLED